MTKKLGFSIEIILCLIFLFVPKMIKAEPVTIINQREDYKVTLDTSNISIDQMKQLVEISPSAGDLIVVSNTILELCIESDPVYFECGSRDINASFFLINAQINLKKASKTQENLNRLQYPVQIKPVLDYINNSFLFYIGLAKTELAFYQSWDISLLKQKVAGLDPSKLCPLILKEIEEAKSTKNKYDLTKHKFHNCLNKAFRSTSQEYPVNAWTDFISSYHIQEVIIEEGED